MTWDDFRTTVELRGHIAATTLFTVFHRNDLHQPGRMHYFCVVLKGSRVLDTVHKQQDQQQNNKEPSSMGLWKTTLEANFRPIA